MASPDDSPSLSTEPPTSEAPLEKPSNVFYPLVLIFGVLFLLTTCAYAVMAARGFSEIGDPAMAAEPDHWLMSSLDKYGLTAMIIELAALALATGAAIAADERRRKQSR